MELRRGSNAWALTVPPDGRMPLGGLAPSRILWRTPRPPTLLPDRGLRLDRLTISTRDVAALRALIGKVTGPVTIVEGDPGLVATFRTQHGPVTFGPA
jgi:hypothetical protein